MIALEILGQIGRATTFAVPLDLHSIRSLRAEYGHQLRWIELNRNAAIKHGRDDIAAALQYAIDESVSDAAFVP